MSSRRPSPPTRRGGRAASPRTGHGGWRRGCSSLTSRPSPTGLINVTDPDSRVVRTHGQPPLQGYNAQAAVNEHQIVVAAELTVDSPDFGHLEPMVNATRRELRRHGLGDPQVVLADAGYWHQRQIDHVVSDGMQVLVPPDGGLRKDTRPGWDGGFYDCMRRVLATPEGRTLYRQRQVTVEPVFGQIKFNRAIKRFQRRGRAACRSEWRLITATHNLLKLHNPGSPPQRPERRSRRPSPAGRGTRRADSHRAPPRSTRHLPDSLSHEEQCRCQAKTQARFVACRHQRHGALGGTSASSGGRWRPIAAASVPFVPTTGSERWRR